MTHTYTDTVITMILASSLTLTTIMSIKFTNDTDTYFGADTDISLKLKLTLKT